MILQRQIEKLNVLRMLADCFCLFLSWMLAFYVRFQVELVAVTRGIDFIGSYIRLFPLVIFFYLFVFFSTKTYTCALEKPRVWEEFFDLFKKHIMAFVLFIAFAYFVFDHRYSRVTLAFFFVFVPVLLPFGRSLVRKLNRFYLKHGGLPKRLAVVIGSSVHAERMQHSVVHRLDWHLQLVGHVSVQEFLQQEALAGIAYGKIDLAFVAPDAEESQKLEEIYEKLSKSLTEILVLPHLGERIFFEPKTVSLDGHTAIALNTSNLNSFGRLLKRVFDVCFSAVFIVAFSPVFLLCALAVRLSSPGPILYKQERMGLDGKKFFCLKFRGMTVDAEKHTGPVWAKPNDDRTTPVGKWLRKTSLDELPQFFNVLKGEMSVVGPRPERPVFVENFTEQIPGYMLRHKAKAGITGWAQINGWRGNTSLEKRLECDLWYLQNWSLWLDFKIVVLTPIKGLVHPNAY